MQRLIAIDGNSLMHRAFYALPPMSTRNGEPTGAIHGFFSMLIKLVEMEPDYMLVAFDMHGPTFRHDEFADYKAGRRETPDDLRKQFPMLKELLRQCGIAVIEVERYEADDIIGTYARMANDSGVSALLVTGDRDALQLINENTHVLMTKKGLSQTVEYDEAALAAEYGLTPGRMPDLKGLMGDSSDNLPGIPGVGEKTALKLLAKYGSMEGALDSADKEKGALREKLLNFADSARMSYKLGLIDTKSPAPATLDECRFEPERLGGGVGYMRELELKSIIGRLPEKARVQAQSKQAREQKPLETIRVENVKQLKALAGKLESLKLIAVHVGDELTIAWEGERQYEIALTGTLFDAGLEAAEAFEALSSVLESTNVGKVVFDAKRLMHILADYGYRLEGLKFDAMIADYLINATRPADSLDTLLNGREAGARGAAGLWRVHPAMLNVLEEMELGGIYRDMEMPLVEVLFEMERVGFAIDRGILIELEAAFKRRICELGSRIHELCGETFNILSTKQLGIILFDKLGLPPQKKTRTGYSTDSEVLEKLEDLNPVVPMIMEYRFVTKLKSTFVDGLLNLSAKDPDGRVHTTFNQNVTVTGRISSTEPNLQNIPVRTQMGREIRRAFIASPGNVLVGADYSQIELRLLAHMSGDPGLIAAFESGEDIHTRTASEVFGTPAGQVTAEQRSAAKAVNFGIVYGISDFGLGKNLHIPKKQAGEYIERYFDRYPLVRAYLKGRVEDGKRDGYVRTLMGRRRELPEILSANYNTRSFGERVAMNMPIQGTAADIIKMAMIKTHSALKRRGLKARLVLQIHDELIVDAPSPEAEEAGIILKEAMEGVMKLKVPLSADVRTGSSWYDTK